MSIRISNNQCAKLSITGAQLGSPNPWAHVGFKFSAHLLNFTSTCVSAPIGARSSGPVTCEKSLAVERPRNSLRTLYIRKNSPNLSGSAKGTLPRSHQVERRFLPALAIFCFLRVFRPPPPLQSG